MYVIKTQNVSEAFVKGLHYLFRNGHGSTSRNGDVMVAPEPVSTVYYHPLERVVFHKERDYNIFFNIYESLWMLAGRNDVAPLTRYVSNFGRYSDNGVTLHGAYGYRWRHHFAFDQVRTIINELQLRPNSRRVVLQMWDAGVDLGEQGADVPCNTIATFQVNPVNGKLDMVVFCRSNDALWGAYFANAFHFSVLLEYVANQTHLKVGTYTQVSVNFHFYKEAMSPGLRNAIIPVNHTWETYSSVNVMPVTMGTQTFSRDEIDEVLDLTDAGAPVSELRTSHPFLRTAARLLELHRIVKANPKDDRLPGFISNHLDRGTTSSDWERSAAIWINRRVVKELL